jgi:signal transduction histidine kinase
VLKHAGASAVNIVLERRRAELRIIIEDNGVGFQPEAIGDSDGGRRRLGLVGIHERALLAGGRVEIESAPGEGTTLYVKIPITPKEREGNL